jgi:hypothetical protein
MGGAMWSRALSRLVLAIGLTVAVIIVYGEVQEVRWRERSDSSSQVSLELLPCRQVIKVGEAPHFTATLINRGDHDVTLVEPGDGSSCGWRTPLLEWSKSKWRESRCGTINALKSGEVFTLKPGGTHHLSGWLRSPFLPRPGLYRVSLKYANDPNLKWSGIPLGQDDETALEEVRHSTRMAAVSNAVEIVVEE